MVQQGLIKPALIALMEDGKERSARQVAKALKCDRQHVRDIFAGLIKRGLAHVPRYGAWRAQIFKLGPGINAEPPPFQAPLAVRERQRLINRGSRAAKPAPQPKPEPTDREIDERYRCPATWWTPADPAVVGAMVAMVRSAHAA